MSRQPPFILNTASGKMPPHIWFAVSAVFHYLGPAFAVLLFPSIGVFGVAWFRIASAAVIFAPITKPWRTLSQANRKERFLLVALGLCLAMMNMSFYLALERLPMSLVAAMEFVGTMLLALFGLRSWRNVYALIFVIIGVFILIDVEGSSDPMGLIWAVFNAILFTAYIALGHQASQNGASRGVELLGAAMLIAFLVLIPIGLFDAIKAMGAPLLVLGGIGVGICSSVIPYICDQLAMARLPRASFALMLALLPVMATLIAAIVLHQVPSFQNIIGIALVMLGIALHQPIPRTPNP